VQRIPGRISRWIKTRRNRALCSGRKPGASLPFRKLAVFASGTSGAQPESDNPRRPFFQ